VTIVFIGPYIYDGMAGSKRLLNMWHDLKGYDNTILVNFPITNSSNFKLKKNQPNNLSGAFHFIRTGLSLIRFIFKSNDSRSFIYFYGYPNITNIAYLLIAKLFHFKIIIDIVEDISIKDYFSSVGNRLKYFSTLFIYRYMLKNIVNGYIVISKHLEKKLLNESGKNFKITLLPISVDLERFPRSDLDDSVKKNSYTLFYGGSFAAKDGFEDILNAFKVLSDYNANKYRLVLTGRIDKKRQKYILNLIKNHTYSDKINYLGFLTDENYYRTLNESDIHLMCRNDTKFAGAGFPFKLGEMLATGKPVIASDIGDISTYIINKLNGILIPPSNYKAIADAVEFITANNKEAQDIGLNGRQTAFKHFNSKIITNNLINFLKNI